MTDIGDKAREDFYSEAQEIIETLSRDLLALDASVRVGSTDPETVNEIFRAVHTLKGLAGLFNASRVGSLSHELENLLDDLRLGRVELNLELLDLLFRAVEVYGRLLAAEKAGTVAAGGDEFDGFMLEVQKASARKVEKAPPLAYEIDPGILAVLTEYEEHRLRNNIQRGMALYTLRAVFQLSSIDAELDALKTRVKALGEILTYLPTGTAVEADAIEIDILMASNANLQHLRAALDISGVRIEEMPKRPMVTQPPPPDSGRAGAPPDAPQALDDRSTPWPVAPAPQPKGRQILSERPLGGGPLAIRADATLRSVAQTVRVDIQKLDHLMSLLGELGILKGSLNRLTERVRGIPEQREVATELLRLHHSFERHLSAMQGGILEVRMVPLGQVFEKLARVVRQLSRELDKEVNLVITGAETEVDKLIVEELSDPLMHMVRNALDHGIERKAQRQRVGKPLMATIALNAFQKGNQVVVEVEDDGAGIDDEALVQAAIAAGVLTPTEAADITKEEALSLVFVPGITTRPDVGKLSGRGVGMDVVKTNINKLGGVVDVESERSIGTKFTITLPITLAIIGALLVGVDGSIYAAPLSGVQEVVLMDASSVRTIEGREVVTLRGESLPICRLDVVFGVRSWEQSVGRSDKLLIVVASAAARRCGFVVDRIFGRQDIVIKALGHPVRSIRGFAGATDLGDERVGLVLDTPYLVQEALSSMSQSRAGAA